MLSSLILEIAMNTDSSTTVTATRLLRRLSELSVLMSASMASPADLYDFYSAIWPRFSVKRPGREPNKVEFLDILQQRHKSPRAVVQRCLTLFRGGERRVADGARSIEVLRHPAEARGKIGAKIFVVPFHRDSGGDEVCDLLAPHEIRIRGQHDRGLDIAAVNAMRVFGLGEQPVGITEAPP